MASGRGDKNSTGAQRDKHGARIALRGVLIAGLFGALAPPRAQAWETGSIITSECHERITREALREQAWPDGRQAPEPTEHQDRILEDMPTHLPREMRNFWSASLLLGVRHVDLEGKDPTDLQSVARQAAMRGKQANHCLRAREDDDTGDQDGDAQALAGCRAFIVEHVERALGEGDGVDMSQTTEAKVYLDFSGARTLELNRFAFELGMALHALQDSFTHTFRDPEGGITHVLNYVELVEGTLDESVDGHRHEGKLDKCDQVGPHREKHFAQAKEASADLMAALQDSAGGRAGRMDRVHAVLDRWLRLSDADCTLDNDYCDAPELQEEVSSGCSALSSGSPPAPGAALLVGLGLGFGRRRRREGVRSGVRRASPWLAWLATLGMLGAAGDAAAQAEAEDCQPGESCLQSHTDEDPGPAFDRGFGLAASAMTSLDEVVYGGSLGLRFDVHDRVILGVDGEYNGWFSLASGRTAPGTFNAYLSTTLVYGTFNWVEVRGKLAAGTTTLLFDLVGAPRGATGPFVGVSVVNLAFRLRRNLRLLVEPGGLYVAIPRVKGIPTARRQHRFMLGLHWTLRDWSERAER